MFTAIFSTLPMFACLFWAITFALDTRFDSRAKRFLALFMSVATVLYFCHAAYFNKEYGLYPITDSIYTFATLAVFPLYYLYILVLSTPSRLPRKHFLVLLPSLLFCLSAIVIYRLMPEEVLRDYVLHWIYGDKSFADAPLLIKAQLIRYRLGSIVFTIQVVPILYWGSRRISKYDKDINNYYSNTEGKTVSWINLILIVFVATSFSSFIMSIIGKEFFSTSPLLLIIPSVLFGTLLYTLGYFGSKQNFTAIDFLAEVQKNDSLSITPPAEQIAKNSLSAAIIQLLEEKELFRQSDIKISDVARMLGTNRTYVSESINKEMNLTFSELINKYRIEYAKELIRTAIRKGEDLNMYTVIEQSGFSAESSFYRVFKLMTGRTPKAWMTEMKNPLL
ncbi:helix-turn-helix transcriptional regulator [Bacteroides sp. OttesenSCG-928-J23]|nr:helix-turn-helix transcriptional regulator [Bacteroides sp. OttesenSCG-928-J23]MDL2299565.1 helix-turn-helix transcriptional regulator [Bacteroides sp. OttesenSCG-928-E20]MDL2305022.1 helix-turn-helix transcriptional regulator [Bacteroides sp. OttesenSCG-928-D19]